MVDFSKHTVGDTVTVHVCDDCQHGTGFRPPKHPADSRGATWPCSRCGHSGIGSTMECVIGNWLELRPLRYPTPATQESGDA